MDSMQMVKYQICIATEAVVDNAAFTSTVVDTAGYDRATFIVHIGTTDVALAALKVQQSDLKTSATALTTGTDVSGLVWGTSTSPDTGAASVIPTASAGATVHTAHVDLSDKKRYMQIQATAGNGTTGTFLNAYCVLSKAGEAPYNATTANLSSRLIA